MSSAAICNIQCLLRPMPFGLPAFSYYQSINQSIRTGSPTGMWLLWLDSDRGLTKNIVVDDMVTPYPGLAGVSGIFG